MKEFKTKKCFICRGPLIDEQKEARVSYGPDGADQIHLKVMVPVQTCRPCGVSTVGDEGQQIQDEAVKADVLAKEGGA